MNKKTFLLFVCASALALSGCSSLFGSKDKTVSADNGPEQFRGVDLVQRAIPTHGQTATTKAYVDHVYVDPGWVGAKSLETISLEDAVANDILISGDFEPHDLDSSHIRGEGVQVFRLPIGSMRPSLKESALGEGMDSGLEAVVNFDLGSSVMINPERLSPIVERASVIAGDFVVLGYTDSLGTEPFNIQLAQERADSVARELVAVGVNQSRIKAIGVGVSTMHPDHASNRRATVLFYVEE